MKTLKCTCKPPKLYFKKYDFKYSQSAYRAVCRKCGFVRSWYESKNYRLIVTGNNVKEGDK